jgi:hypothetical protein
MSLILPFLNTNTGLDKLSSILNDAGSGIDFFGRKFIIIKNENKVYQVSLKLFSGYISRQALFCSLGNKDFDKEHRLRAVGIIDKLKGFNSDLQDKISNSNILTRIFSFVRDLFSSDVSYKINAAKTFFCMYSNDQKGRSASPFL